jgi:hypothetical protein
MATLSGDLVFVALTPSASYAFERCAIRYSTVMDYCFDDTECHIEGLKNFNRIKCLITVLEKEIAHFHNISTLTPAQHSIYNLKFLLDGLWTTILRLKKIIDREKPAIIYLYTSKLAKPRIGRFAFSNDESVYREVLLMAGWQITIKVICTNPSNVDIKETVCNGSLVKKSFFIDWLQNLDLLINLGIIFKREGFAAAGNAFFKSLKPDSSTPVLIYNSGYNWDDSLAEFYRQGLYPVYRITDESVDLVHIATPDYYDQIIEICASHSQLREFDEILGIDVSAFFFNRFSQILATSIKESVAAYQFAQKKIQQKKVQCLLLATRERAMGYAILQAARDAKKPVVSWQHGGGGYAFWPMIPFFEFYDSDVHFVFSKSVAQNYIESAKKIGLSKLPVFYSMNSSSLDNFYKKIRKGTHTEKRKNIVYITTHYANNLFHISSPFNPLAVDDRLWVVQKRILDFANSFPDINFIVKLHPTHYDKEPLKSYVNDKNIKNIQIISSEKSILDIMHLTDIIITDHITTSILQILTSDIPVFVYNGISRVEDEALASLKKRTYVYDDVEIMITDLVRYIPDRTTLDPSVNCLNTDFILKYGTDITRLNSAENAAKKLKEIIADSLKKQ